MAGFEFYQPSISDLPSLLESTEYLVDAVSGPWSMIVVPREHRYLMRESWLEIQPKIEDMKKDCVRPGRVQRALEAAGLTGQQLRLKLQAVATAWKRFSDHGSTKLLASLVGWTKIVIDSFAKAIPYAEQLKEILDVIERFLKGEEVANTLT